jgi:hypothetical protein
VTWADAVVLAWRSLGRRFGRAVLTFLAVAMAAALLTALVTIAGTGRTRVLAQLSKGGPLAGIKVAAAAPDPEGVDSDNPRAGAARPIDPATIVRIRNLHGVASVAPVLAVRQLVLPLSSDVEEFFETMVGVDMRNTSRLPITLLAGRLPAPGSLTETAVTLGYLQRVHLAKDQAAAAVGTEVETAAPRDFPGLPDPDVRGRWSRLTVVGVVAQDAAPGMLLVPIEQAQSARDFTLGGPFGTRFGAPSSPYSGLLVVADGLDRVAPLREEITRIGYSTSAPENLIATVERYLHVVEIVLTAIGLIALVIASIGIASALLAAVRERRREIGVLKAIGARDRDVRRIFLLEAGLIGLAGGLAGTVAGWLVARSVATVVNGYLASEGLRGVAVGFGWVVGVLGIVGTTVLALVAGTIPATRASRVSPREAVDSL